MHPHFIPELSPWLPWMDRAGLAVFAASGALAAARAGRDIVAACFFAIVTATGGGTTRDLLIGAPVFWMHDSAPVTICLAVAVLVWLVPRRWWPERALDWCDAAGLAAYAVYGAGKALHFGIPPLPAAIMGVVTACMGGIVRDVVAGVPSIILRRELYVTAAAVAAGLSTGLVLLGLESPWPAMIGAAAGFGLRAGAIAKGLSLPGYSR
jgi:uncharacterized membrane protein YeiH